MAELIENGDNFYKIWDIIDNSREFLVLVTPFYKLHMVLLDKIKAAVNRGVKVVFICRSLNGSGSLSVEDVTDFEGDLKGLPQEVYVGCLENLNVNMYLDENNALITSMNLRDSSSCEYFEYGYFCESGEAMYNSAYCYVLQLMSHSPKLKGIRLKKGLFSAPDEWDRSSGKGLFSAPGNDSGLFRRN